MPTTPAFKTHFSDSSATATPGFASPLGSTTRPPPPTQPPANNFFTNASSTYQSHFGSFGAGGSGTTAPLSAAAAVLSPPSAFLNVSGPVTPPSASIVGGEAKSVDVGVVGPTAAAAVARPANGCGTPSSRAPTPVGGLVAYPCSGSVPVNAASAQTAVTGTEENIMSGSLNTSINNTISNNTCTATGAVSSSGGSPHLSTPSAVPQAKFAAASALIKRSPLPGSTLLVTVAPYTDGFGAVDGYGTEPRPRRYASDACLPPPELGSAAGSSTGTTPRMNASFSASAFTEDADTGVGVIGELSRPHIASAEAVSPSSTAAAAARSFGLPHVSARGNALSPTSPASLSTAASSPTTPNRRAAPLLPPQVQPHLGGMSGSRPFTPVSTGSANGNGHHHPATATGPREAVINVYDSDFKTLLSIPASQVVHRPHPSLGVSRLVLCRNYGPKQANHCTKGELCKFVHADITGATRCSIHVNYAWRSLEACTYPRLPPGEALTVLAPNERPPAETLLSERVLVTRGSTNWRDHAAPLSHCAHYYFNRMCNRGERCNFIHAVHVDPTVQGDFKRAPAPTAVAPIMVKSPTTPTLCGPGEESGAPRSPYHASRQVGTTTTAAPPSLPVSTVNAAAPGGYANMNAGPGALPNSRSNSPHVAGAFAFAAGGYGAPCNNANAALPPPPPLPPSPSSSASGNCMGYTMAVPPPPPPPLSAAMGHAGSGGTPAASPTPYLMFANGAVMNAPTGMLSGGPGGGGSSAHMPPMNGVYLLVPAQAVAQGSGGGNGCVPVSPVSPLGQSLGSLSNGPVDWPFYGDLDTAAWMPPPSPSSRM